MSYPDVSSLPANPPIPLIYYKSGAVLPMAPNLDDPNGYFLAASSGQRFSAGSSDVRITDIIANNVKDDYVGAVTLTMTTYLTYPLPPEILTLDINFSWLSAYMIPAGVHTPNTLFSILWPGADQSRGFSIIGRVVVDHLKRYQKNSEPNEGPNFRLSCGRIGATPPIAPSRCVPISAGTIPTNCPGVLLYFAPARSYLNVITSAYPGYSNTVWSAVYNGAALTIARGLV